MVFGEIIEMVQGWAEAILDALHKIAKGAKLGIAATAEMLTGHCCEKCEHYAKGSCWHPDFETRDKCMTSIRPVGFQKRKPRYLKPVTDLNKLQETGRYVTEAGMEVKPAPLTPEEQYQLEKIKGVLQEAEDHARESGLLED